MKNDLNVIFLLSMMINTLGLIACFETLETPLKPQLWSYYIILKEMQAI